MRITRAAVAAWRRSPEAGARPIKPTADHLHAGGSPDGRLLFGDGDEITCLADLPAEWRRPPR